MSTETYRPTFWEQGELIGGKGLHSYLHIIIIGISTRSKM